MLEMDLGLEMGSPEDLDAAAEWYERFHAGVWELRPWAEMGTFHDDGVWRPDNHEKRGCCGKIRTLYRDAVKYQPMMAHCSSILHIAIRFSVDYKMLRVHIAARRARRGDVRSITQGETE